MNKTLTLIPIAGLISISLVGCYSNVQAPSSASGVKMAYTKVQTDSNGETVEQRNIKERLKRDNAAGSIKFLYVVSPFTGDLIASYTVKGKVTSSGKRLVPSDLEKLIGGRDATQSYLKRLEIDGSWYATNENPGDDGTYGDSIPYLYWIDENNVYHQLYATASIIQISDKPMTFNHTTQTNEQSR